ncbi:hypothetical protein [Kineosporia succinea]|uniref:Uncharacterized protein n=1 Tax=Kineosporia succinea TaxID=84632 RepID=A0ABT9P9H3_9ACTN|nr:hypothetical protein [Kineosporia succinea]MDP9829346.1 hypothetical protein [Kineosporia succinea]
MSPERAEVEGFCSAAYPHAHTLPPEPDTADAWQAGVERGSGGDQEAADLAYLAAGFTNLAFMGATRGAA